MTSGHASGCAGWVKSYFQQGEIVQVAHLTCLDLLLYFHYAEERVPILAYTRKRFCK